MTLFWLFSHDIPLLKLCKLLLLVQFQSVHWSYIVSYCRIVGILQMVWMYCWRVIWHRNAMFLYLLLPYLKCWNSTSLQPLIPFFYSSTHLSLLAQPVLFKLPYPILHQSQCSCRSCASRKSVGIPSGVSAPAGPGGMVRSSHSMLSNAGSDRPMLREEGGEEESQKDRSEVSMGE